MCVCVGKRARGEAERESDSKQRPLPLIKLRSNYAKRLQIRKVVAIWGDVQDEGAQYGAEKERRGGEEERLTEPGHPSLHLSFERSSEGQAGHIQEDQPPFGHDPQNNWQEEGFSRRSSFCSHHWCQWVSARSWLTPSWRYAVTSSCSHN